MERYVALLRGINVGKTKRIAMSDLRDLFERAGFTAVRTHLNSGNVVFAAGDDSDEHFARKIEAAISSDLGMDVPVIVRSGEEMQRVVANNPFTVHEDDPKTLHVTFLEGTPEPARVQALENAEQGEDEFRVTGKEVYLHYPNGISGAVFMPTGLDQALAMHTTSRNWRTVVRLAELTSDA